MEKSTGVLLLIGLCACIFMNVVSTSTVATTRMWGAVPIADSMASRDVVAKANTAWEVRGRFAGSQRVNSTDDNGSWLIVVSWDSHEVEGAIWLGDYNAGEDAFLIYPTVSSAPSGWEDRVLAQESASLRIVGQFGNAILVAKPAAAAYPSLWPAASFLTVRPISDVEVQAPVAWEDTIASKIDTSYNDLIAGLVAQVDAKRLSTSVEYLSNNFFSRLAYTTSNSTIEAQKWLMAELIKLGLQVTAEPFRSGYTDNIIAVKPGVGDPTTVVLLGAHYDSRGPRMDPAVRAPGADDNGSGTSAVLEIARILSTASFEHTIRFCLWSGEEQGLYGSNAYAKKLSTAVYNKEVSVVAYLNADMISYKVPTEPVQLGMDSESVTPGLVAQLKTLAAQYVPSLVVGDATGCCTDNMGFYDNGFATASYFERRGGIRNPYYHTSQDAYPASSNSFEQVSAITQAFLAGVATLAVPQDL